MDKDQMPCSEQEEPMGLKETCGGRNNILTNLYQIGRIQTCNIAGS